MKQCSIILEALFASFFLFACAQKEEDQKEIAIESVTISQPVAELKVGETLQLRASVTPSNASNATISWSSSRQSVATVSNIGIVTALSEGESTVYATAGGKRDQCVITVFSSGDNSGGDNNQGGTEGQGDEDSKKIGISAKTCSLYEGDTFTLTLSNLQGRTSTWTSSNNTIASVVDGVVTAYKAGTATITAKVDKYEVSCEVTVLYLNPDCVITYTTESGSSLSSSMLYQYYTGIKTIGNLISDTYNNGIGRMIFQDPITSIPKEAFYSNYNIFFIEISLPNSVRSIGEDAFENTGVRIINLGNSLETIGERAFAGTRLETVILPGSVKEIRNSAFSGCKSLKSITLSKSLKTIGEYAFYDCTSLASVTFSSSLERINSSAFKGCTSLKSISIPNSVTSIGKYAFRDCTSLASVTLSNSLERIEEYTFAGCTSLKSISIPNSVTSIGNHAFNDCTSLTSVSLSSSLERIEDYAFTRCPITGVLSLPRSLKYIGAEAFDISHLDGFNLVDLSSWCSTELHNWIFGNCILYVNNKRVSDLIIPKDVSSINDRVFYNFVFDSVTIPGSVTSIGERAIGITKKITIGKIIEKQPLDSFCPWWKNVEEVIIDNSATSVVKKALYGENYSSIIVLKKVTMPETITSIGDNCIYTNNVDIDLYIYATTPPEIDGSYRFFETGDNSRIFVPKNSVNKYKDKYPWSSYKSRIYPIE